MEEEQVGKTFKKIMVKNNKKSFFDNNGYFLLRKLFSDEECKKLRLEINRHFKLPLRELKQNDINFRTFVEPDGVTKNKKFWKIIFNKKILSVIRSIIGKDICYTQHSDLHINLGAGKYHRDNAFRLFKNGPDWYEEKQKYKVLRIAIYLSDYKTSGSSLIVFPNSNKKETFLTKIEMRFWNYLRFFWSKRLNKNYLSHFFFSSKTVNLKHKAGDCIIFDQRMIHAGGVVNGDLPKYSIFLSFGAKNNLHTNNHHKYYLSRPTYLRKIPIELKKRLKDSKLLLTSKKI